MANVTIIMPVYNAGVFLDATLQSIQNQTFTDWELVAINDFSDDNSLEILEQYSKNDIRINVYNNDGKGIIPGLEKAYSLANGKYITRMDADDIMPEYKIERLVAVLEDNDSVCATGYVQYFSDDKVYDGYKRYAEWLNDLVDRGNHYADIYKECVVPSPCWMMSRETIEKIGGITTNRYPEDYDLIFRLYQYDVPIVGIPDILHLWRDHGNRASRNDDNYADQSFLDLKIYYFQELDYDSKKEVVVWGAGTAGKNIAKKLIEKEISFRWITDNDRKIGLDIYGVKLESMDVTESLVDTQIILAIKQKNFKEENAELIKKLSESNAMFPFF